MRREKKYLSGESVRRDHVGVIWGESRPAAISLVKRIYRRGEKKGIEEKKGKKEKSINRTEKEQHIGTRDKEQ